MTPQDNLKRLKGQLSKAHKDDDGADYYPLERNFSFTDIHWLIARVEQLEGALEYYSRNGDFYPYEDPDRIKNYGGVANTALSTGPKISSSFSEKPE